MDIKKGNKVTYTSMCTVVCVYHCVSPLYSVFLNSGLAMFQYVKLSNCFVSHVFNGHDNYSIRHTCNFYSLVSFNVMYKKHE